MFTYHTIVRYEDLDSEGLVKATAVLQYLQNTAVMHSACAGYDIYKMAELDLGWVVMCWDLQLGRRIRWNEKLTVETWPYSFSGSFGKRCFQLLSEDGEVLAQADSWWALLRLSDQTMVKPEPAMTEAFGVGGRPFFTLRRPKGSADCVQTEFPVTRFDIDTNDHVNNSRFAEMACSYVPEMGRVRELMIEYKHPAHLGDWIVPAFSLSEDGAYVCLSQRDGTPYVKMKVQYEIS